MKINREFFARGFLNRMSSVYNLEKLAQYGQPMDFGEKLGDKLSEAMANAIAFKAVQGVMGAGSMASKIRGPKLGMFEKKFIKKLMTTDSILKDRPKDRVMSHYTTLASLAPSISKDPNTVASFLRTSTAYDTIDTVMIKTLIDIEAGYRQRDTSNLDTVRKFTNRGAR